MNPTPRKITAHAVNPCNDTITIEVMDAPGAGNASHLYHVSGFNTKTNPACPFTERYGAPADHATILFQNGPINEAGVNGITQEVLLAVVEDRLRSFQLGPYRCAENELARQHVTAALEILKSRTLSRMNRGVEGTHKI